MLAFAEKESDVDSAQMLDSIDVTAYRFALDTLSVPVNSQVITSEEIRQSASSTLPEMLRKVGNVRFMSFSGNDAEGNLAMRGFGENSQSRVLVLVDGLRYNPMDMSSINWSKIPLYNIDQVEILRGSQSVMYGSFASTGVIKISTKRATEGQDLYLDAMYGSYNSYNLSATGLGRTGDFFYSVNASMYNSDGFRNLSSAWSNSVGASLGYDFSENVSLILRGDYSESFNEYPNGLSWDDFKNNPQKANSSTKYNNRAGIYTANLSTESASGKGSITAGLNFRDRIIDTFTKNDQWTYTFAPSYEVDCFENWKIFTGIDLGFSTIDYGKDTQFISPPMIVNTAYANVDRFDAAYYLSANYELDKKLSFFSGARAEFQYTSVSSTEKKYLLPILPPIVSGYSDSNWATGIAADFGVVYKINEESSLYGRFNQIYHYPMSDEIASYQGYGTTVFTFNKDLKPEHGQNYEIGYKFLNNEWRANVNFFFMYLNDEIQWNNIKQINENLEGPTIRYGIDFDAGYDSKYWGVSVAGTLVDAQFAGGEYKGNTIPLVAPFNGVLTVYAKPLENVTTLLRTTYFSSQVMGNDNSNTSNHRIPSYCTLDFQVNLTLTRHITMFGAIENITDETYAAFAYNGSFYPNAGRTLKIGVNIKL